MKIKECPSLRLARQVVNLIQLPSRIAKECSIESWSNCREQGLHVSRYGGVNLRRAVNVSEARSSDQIFVCYGDSREFNHQTHQESEAIWQHQKKYFDRDARFEAAKWIAGYLETGKV